MSSIGHLHNYSDPPPVGYQSAPLAMSRSSNMAAKQVNNNNNRQRGRPKNKSRLETSGCNNQNNANYTLEDMCEKRRRSMSMDSGGLLASKLPFSASPAKKPNTRSTHSIIAHPVAPQEPSLQGHPSAIPSQMSNVGGSPDPSLRSKAPASDHCNHLQHELSTDEPSDSTLTGTQSVVPLIYYSSYLPDLIPLRIN